MTPGTRAMLEKELRELESLVKNRSEVAQERLKQVQEGKEAILGLNRTLQEASMNMSNMRGHHIVSLDEYRLFHDGASVALEARREKLQQINQLVAEGKTAASEAKRIQVRVEKIGNQLRLGPAKVISFERT